MDPLTVPQPARPSAHDVVAGLAVALVLVPQAIAYAQLAGLSPEAGLIGAAAGAVVAACLASYPLLQTGPTALTAALTLGALGAAAGEHDVLLLGALLALLVGAIRIGLGLARAGGVAFLLSEPVLAGLLPGITISISLTQLPALLGAPRSHASRTVVAAWDAISAPGAWHLPTVALAAVALAAIALARFLDPRVPVIAGLVGASMAWAWASGYDGRVVGAVDLVWPGLPTRLPWSAAPSLLLGAALIALVGFVEPTTIVRAHEDELARWDPDRELVAQGAGNIASGLLGGMPVGGSFSRTALVEAAGGRTRAATIVAGLLVALSLPAAGLLVWLPAAVPAAIVAGAVAGLLRLDRIGRLRRISRPQFLVAIVALVATIALSPRIDLAVGASVAFSIVVHLWRETQMPVGVEREGEVLVLVPRGVVWFGSANAFERLAVRAMDAHRDATRVVIDLSCTGRCDVTGAHAVARVLRRAAGAHAAIELRGVPATAGGMIHRALDEEGVGAALVGLPVAEAAATGRRRSG